MQGPQDNTIEISPVPAGVGTQAPGTQRLPGGKALSRLLVLLAAKGHMSTAMKTIEAALPETAREKSLAIVAQYSPEGQHDQTGTSATDEPQAVAEKGWNVGEEFLKIAAALGLPTGAPTGSGPQWRSLGPYTIPNGQTYGSSRVNVSGRVASIAIDPSNAAHVLCGAANGGVWESFDRGASWAPRTDYAATTAVGAVIFDPVNPHIVYCGTGEGNWWSGLGVGILRSADGGTNWSTLCTNPFVGQGFF